LQKENHDITIISREKDVTTHLLEHYGIGHFSISSPGIGFMGLLRELFIRNKELVKLHKKEKFNLAFGTSVSIAHLTAFTNVKSYNFHEDDDSVVPLQSILIYPFTSKIINPDCVKINGWRKKRVFHKSYHELAYLHPNNFVPDPKIPGKYGLERRKYVLVRLSALKAHHDHKKVGISDSFYQRIKKVIKNYLIVESSESANVHSFEPWDIHDLISFSKMVISDSQTTTAEAAILGVPSIRYNLFVGRLSYLEELEKKYMLTYGFTPGQENQMITKIRELLLNPHVEEEWRLKRNLMLSEKTDLNEWMINYFHSLI
jgi:hypothetical protein|tara:strand:- start:127 stop:1074 length:948 start_codon:yes stop_codon:yes gene_type:complete